MSYHTIIFLILLACSFQPTQAQIDISNKIDGLSMVAPPKPFTANPAVEMQQVSAEWVALIPYGFTRKGDTKVIYRGKGQWWGETLEGLEKSIQICKKAGMKIMLKPQVYVPGGWVGEMDTEDESAWSVWESSYRAYIFRILNLAIEYEVELFCVGTEYKIAAHKREDFWRALIQEIRVQYVGQLTYSSNWDHYDKIPFWDALDYIGLSAYFPLSEEVTPDIEDLKEAWKPIKEKLRKLANKHDKPILFTEYGYLSADHCADKTWLNEDKIHQLPVNELAQANALEAMYATYWNEAWWAGGFLWKWFPNGMGHEGYFDKDYTPQGKMAEEVLRKWFK